jgi:hypothetical protein
VVVLPDEVGRDAVLIGAAALLGAVVLLSLIAPLFERPRREARA